MYATNGTIFTEFYGEQFDADKVEQDINLEIQIHPPSSVKSDQDVTLHFEVEKMSMRNIVDGFEQYREDRDDGPIVAPGLNSFNKNYSPPKDQSQHQEFRGLYFYRRVSSEDIKKMDMKLMPGPKVYVLKS